ncbi:MAG: lipopolysaccharide heptosyltransferase I, partial [Pseudomonadota bacterium]
MRVLVVKMSSMGDIVHALPAVTDLAAQGDEVHWVVEEAFAPIVAAHQSVARVLPIAWRRWRAALLLPWTARARAARQEFLEFRNGIVDTEYDLVIDGQGLYKSAVVTRWARAETKVGFDRDSIRERGAERFYTESVAVPVGWHAVDRLRRLFAVAAGYSVPTALDFGLGAPDPAPGPPVALLLHGTSWRNKEYPQVLWQSVAAEAAAAGYQVALTWNDAVERRRAEAIAAAVGGQVWSRMALPALIDRLRGVSLTIGVDSGIGHLAAAMGIPSVGLYGASDAIRTGLKGPRAQSLA